MATIRLSRAIEALLGLALACHLSGQVKTVLSHESRQVARKADPGAPCEFGPEYRRISSNKADPRVAFIELDKLTKSIYRDTDLHFLEPIGFENACKMIGNQAEDTATLFDKERGYLHMATDDGHMDGDRSLAFFSGRTRKPGVMLVATRFLDVANAFVFVYRAGKWEDVTSQYLGPLHLDKNDYVVVPQYGRTARVMSADSQNEGFHHKCWFHWDGAKFQLSRTKPNDWRCPDKYDKNSATCRE